MNTVSKDPIKNLILVPALVASSAIPSWEWLYMPDCLRWPFKCGTAFGFSQ